MITYTPGFRAKIKPFKVKTRLKPDRGVKVLVLKNG